MNNAERGTMMDPNVKTKAGTAIFTNPASAFIINSGSNSATASPPLTVTKEDVGELFYNGSEYFTTPSPTNYSGTVILQSYIKDSVDGARGDIRKANVTFRDGGVLGTLLGTPNNPVGLINPGPPYYDGISSTSFSSTFNNSYIINR